MKPAHCFILDICIDFGIIKDLAKIVLEYYGSLPLFEIRNIRKEPFTVKLKDDNKVYTNDDFEYEYNILSWDPQSCLLKLKHLNQILYCFAISDTGIFRTVGLFHDIKEWNRHDSYDSIIYPMLEFIEPGSKYSPFGQIRYFTMDEILHYHGLIAEIFYNWLPIEDIFSVWQDRRIELYMPWWDAKTTNYPKLRRSLAFNVYYDKLNIIPNHGLYEKAESRSFYPQILYVWHSPMSRVVEKTNGLCRIWNEAL